MADVKMYKMDELRKMGLKDRQELLKKIFAVLAQHELQVRMNEDKQSHKIKAYKVQIARIRTVNNEESMTSKQEASLTPDNNAK